MSSHPIPDAIVFETALGFMALGWSAVGMTRAALPEREESAALAHATRWSPGACLADPNNVPSFVAEASHLVTRYASGETVDFSTLPLDFAGIDPFRRAIYLAALRLRQGEVVTYGELAERAGFPRMARETGTALGRNPMPLLVPCHRIVAAGGRIGGFSAPGGVATKARLLAHEGVRPEPPAQAAFTF